MNALDFAPPLLRIRGQPPAPLAGWTLRLIVALLAGLLLWACLGRLDIVAVAEGKLVPSSYLKIVQPAEQGIVKEILVSEARRCKPARCSRAWTRRSPTPTSAIRAEHDPAHRCGRIDAARRSAARARQGDPPLPSRRRRRYETQRARLAQRHRPEARHRDKGAPTRWRAVPRQAGAGAAALPRAGKGVRKADAGRGLPGASCTPTQTAREDRAGFAEFTTAPGALDRQSEKKILQISADYRRCCRPSGWDAAQSKRQRRSSPKQPHRQALGTCTTRAWSGISPHIRGTVAAPGTILMTSCRERRRSRRWVSNDDVGFCAAGAGGWPARRVPVPSTACSGHILHLNPDATRRSRIRAPTHCRPRPADGPARFPHAVELSAQESRSTSAAIGCSRACRSRARSTSARAVLENPRPCSGRSTAGRER